MVWAIVSAVLGIAPDARSLVLEAIRAIRSGDAAKAARKAEEAARRHKLYKAGRDRLDKGKKE